MPRIRSLKPDLPGDKKLALAAREARYMFVLLITQADDDGLVRGEPRELLGNLYPHDADVSIELMDGWLEDLRRPSVGSIRFRWTRDGSRVIQLVNWERHQLIKNRSKPFLLTQLESEPDASSHGSAERDGRGSGDSLEDGVMASGGSGGAECGCRSPDLGVLNTHNTLPGWGALLDEFRRAEDCDAVVAFLRGLPKDQPSERWVARLGGYLKGLDMPGNQPATVDAVATACRDYPELKGDYSPAHFRRCVDRAMRDGARIAQRGAPGKTRRSYAEVAADHERRRP